MMKEIKIEERYPQHVKYKTSTCARIVILCGRRTDLYVSKYKGKVRDDAYDQVKIEERCPQHVNTNASTCAQIVIILYG